MDCFIQIKGIISTVVTYVSPINSKLANNDRFMLNSFNRNFIYYSNMNMISIIIHI